MYNVRTGGTMATSTPSKSGRLGLRLSPSHRTLLESAASIRQQSLSEFVLASTLAAAEEVILDQRLFLVSDQKFERLQSILDAPAVIDEKLLKLLKTQAPWE